MKTLRRIINLVLLAALASALPAFAATADVTVYAFTNTNAFGTLDLNNGTFTQSGSLPFGGYTGLGDFAGNLYIDGQYFWQVNPANGSVTQIGGNSVNCRELGSTTSGMYCLDNSTNKILYSVSPIDGTLTQIGMGTGLPPTNNVTLSSGGTVLYCVENYGSGPVLYAIDTTSGSASERGNTELSMYSSVFSMVFADGQLYADANNPNAIYTLDITSGVASLLHTTDILVYGMDAGPISTFTYKKLHDFTAGSDGATPLSGLTMDSGGNLYGTAYAGGAGYGTAYQLLNSGTSWSFSPIYTFAGGNTTAGTCFQGGVRSNGGLYGTTYPWRRRTRRLHRVGYTGCGTVFNLKRQPCRTAPACAWSETLLYQFQGNARWIFALSG